MSLADELYRETILDHYHNPRNRGELNGTSVISVEGVNPLCGDELTLFLDVNSEGKVENLSIKGRGCSINTASGSMMSEVVKGLSLAEVEDVIGKFKTMMTSEEQVELPDELEDLEALSGVRQYPVRIKCALLPWTTLIEGLRCAKEHVLPEMISTE